MSPFIKEAQNLLSSKAEIMHTLCKILQSLSKQSSSINSTPKLNPDEETKSESVDLSISPLITFEQNHTQNQLKKDIEYPNLITIPDLKESGTISENTVKHKELSISMPDFDTNVFTDNSLIDGFTKDRLLKSLEFYKNEEIYDTQERNSCILDYVLENPCISDKKPKLQLKKSMSTENILLSKLNISENDKMHKYNINDFEFIKAVNSGSFGKICLVKMKNTNEIYAMKVINSEEAIITNREDYIASEWEVFKQVDSEHIVRCFYTFLYSKYLCFVMEYMNGGDLSFLMDRYVLYESEAKFYIAELILALEYLHNKGIIHRDVKPANILIGADGHIKLCDFGLSMCQYKSEDSLLKSGSCGCDKNNKKVGTAYYMAPEIIKENHISFDCDWWAVGIILYEMLLGKLPFQGDNIEEICKNIINRNISEYKISHNLAENQENSENTISYEAHDLIQKLLQLDPNKRLGHSGAHEIKAHPFFKNTDFENIRNSKPSFIPIDKKDELTYYFPEKTAFSLEEFINTQNSKIPFSVFL